jgi:Penicillinase repressor
MPPEPVRPSPIETETQIPPPLHDLEGEVMEEVWRRHEASVRGVMEALNAGASKDRAYTTYMTITDCLLPALPGHDDDPPVRRLSSDALSVGASREHDP